MTSFYKPIIFTLLFLAALHPARSQSLSNAGKEFWIPFSYHYAMNPGIGGDLVSMSIYVTSNVNTAFSVEIFGLRSLQPKRAISAGETVKIDIPTPKDFYLDSEKVYSNRIFRVLADDPVVVYSYISRGAQSAATVCLPVQVLGKEYYSMNFTQKSNENFSHSYITIIAVEDGITEVEIIPSGKTSTGKQAGVPYTVQLSKGQAYQLLGTIDNFRINNVFSGVDLTGSKISTISSGVNTCKRIAVFSGSGKVTIGNGCTGTSDNLYQQLYPFNSWGNNYLAIPSYRRPFNFYRIIAKDPSTTVSINGGGSVTLQQVGSVYMRDYPANNTPVKIESTGGNICVAQYFTSADCNGNPNPYDPEMIILNSVDQNIKEVNLVNARLLASEQNPYPSTGTTPHEHHLHVILKNQGTALSSFKFDGISVPVSLWKPHPQDGTYYYLYIDDFRTVTQGYHNLSSDSGFNALAYGYARNESYGYSAGANVRDKYQYLSIKNDSATIQKLQTCNGRPFYFDITVPYEVNQLDWQFADNVLPAGSITSPVSAGTKIVDNKTLYTYQLPSPFVKASPGNYTLKLKMQINNAAGCSGSEESEFDFEVRERPKAGFSDLKNCVSDPIIFTDTSRGYGSFLTKKFWDLGDGSLAGGDNVAHQYATANTYTVKHWVVNDIGCLSDTAVLTKVVDPLPQAGMAFTAAVCEKRVLPLSDNSIPNTTDISSYKWAVNPSGLVSNAKNPSFILDMGTYNIQHIVINDKSCTDTVTQSVTVNEVPKANFEAPKACLVDPAAPFTNLTPYITGFPFTYLWNFGDPGSATNSSTVENPSHKYNTQGNFVATLKVTSSSGCDSTKEVPFTINGVNPDARFDALSLCSNKDVILQNKSKVIDGGEVVKVEVYWDPLNDTVDNDPRPGSLYQHKYGLLTMPVATTTYNVRYIAYSGLTCRDILDTTVVVLASPVVQFDPLRSICQEKVDTLITVTETTTISGSGVFSGTGVTTLSSNSAEFKPGSAGPGKHKVSYTFTADNGCKDTASRIITVNPTPTNVSAGGDASGKVYMLEEDSVVLKGKASGLGLTYLWVPAANMNNDKLDTPKVSPSDDQLYTFTATTDSGCKASASVNVVVLKKIVVPNAFTPNGDGINDYWVITPLDIYPDATVQVYTRYGQLVYESRGYGRPWDGTYNGKPLPIATYYWVIDPKRRKPINGTVSIIR